MCQRNLDGTIRNPTKTRQRSLASQRESTSVAMKLTALLFALVFVALTAGAPSEDRIYGGEVAPAAVPYLVSIVTSEQHICGGWIYNNGWVVTAASCVVNYEPSQLTVIVGQLSLIQPDTDEASINVFLKYIHENYDNVTKLNDIAMLQLASNMTFGTNVQLIRYEEADETGDVEGVFAGWGGTAEENLPSTKLRTMTMTIPGDCKDYTADEYKQNYMLCAGTVDDTSSPCHYDEGSPLVQTIGSVEYVVGIMSKNKGCGPSPVPSTIYTRLSAYYAWFNRIAGLQPPLPPPV